MISNSELRTRMSLEFASPIKTYRHNSFRI